MMYDVFMEDGGLASDVSVLMDKAYMIDRTDKPDVYQFFDVTEGQLSIVKRIIESRPESFEIRGSSDGARIWPSQSGVGIRETLDII